MTRTAKGERTRERIVEAALRLFRAYGYDETTMREVAQEADVSLGNAYYYFRSKEHLLYAFYNVMHEAHLKVAEPILEKERDLQKRLLGVLEAKLHVIEPYHRFSGRLFTVAGDPQSPLSPFHRDAADTRRENTELFRRVLEGSRLKIPADIAAELPDLLWIYSMGIVLYWIHDESPRREKTRRLMEHSSEIVVRVIKLLSNPLLRPLRKATLKMLADLKEVDA